MIPFPAIIYCASTITVLFLYYFSRPASAASRKNSQTSNSKESRGKSGSSGSLNKVKLIEASDIYRQVDIENEWRNNTPVMHRRRHGPRGQQMNLSEDTSDAGTLKSASNSNLDDSNAGESTKETNIWKKISKFLTSLLTRVLNFIGLSQPSGLNLRLRSGSSILQDDFSFKVKKNQIDDNFK
jgi:hypothetical protein